MRRGEFAQDFPIEEHYTNLNHGSFGVCPLPVSRHVRSISDSHQISFGKFRSERLDNLLIASRKALSGILGTNYENLVYVRNASEALQTAVNAVKIMGEQGSLYLKRIVTTNHEYSSTNELLSDLAATLEIPLIIVNISHRSREAVTTALLEQAGDCSLVLVSHITSPWAERLDIDSLAGQLPLSSVLIVDAAHSPGCSPIGREVYERAFVAMSLHKWGFFPLGTGALSTPSDYHNFTKPVVCSLYHNQSYAKRFSWVGTDNYLNYLVGETVADWFNMLTEKNWDFGQFLI
ncbi:MAG: aminotransferase class V-fold PLP-dependent enzyme, partial [Actinomycetaceae bacterium]|nr:aminotransferase class V-fold PLP-dependent enzyme [Actinomycetaceae bacterium]